MGLIFIVYTSIYIITNAYERFINLYWLLSIHWLLSIPPFSYMKATLQASVELQKSMNVLFQFQQNAQKLDDLKSQIQDTKEELKTVKHRLIEKEKERRQYKQQVENQELLLKQKTCEITELTKILGESSEDLAQMKIDAKYVNTVTVELNACKRKNKTLKDEVIRLRKMQDKNNASDAVVQDSINLSDEKYSGVHVTTRMRLLYCVTFCNFMLFNTLNCTCLCVFPFFFYRFSNDGFDCCEFG